MTIGYRTGTLSQPRHEEDRRHDRHSRTYVLHRGGGPAGMMLGVLLARAGIAVIVLEKHADFLRDFRGDTDPPLDARGDGRVGLLDDFLKLPHEKVPRIAAQFGDRSLTVADFSHLPVQRALHRHDAAMGFPRFPGRRGQARIRLRSADATTACGLIEERRCGRGSRADRASGAAGRSAPTGDRRRRSSLDFARGAGFGVEELGAPMDVLWFRLPRTSPRPVRDDGALRRRPHPGHAQSRRLLAMRARHPERTADDAVRARGLDAFRKTSRQ